MGRPRRICLPNLTYHTYSRCINCMNMMSGEKIKDLFVKVIQLAQKKYKFDINHYVIMDNHFHIVIKTKQNGESISTIMQFIKSLFARFFNKLVGRIGPFWNERFKDKIIEKASNPLHYALRLLWYIPYNPVRKGIVNDPRDYSYSSINFYLQHDYQGPIDLIHHDSFIELGNNFDERVSNFLGYELNYKAN